MKIPNLEVSEEVAAVRLLPMLEAVRGSIQRVQYLRLRQRLTDATNPEINTDREALISRMEQMGFRHEIVQALDDLDRKLFAAGTPLDFKGCMDLIRTIFEEIVEDAAKKAAAKTTAKLPSGQVRDFQPWKDLLMTAKVLTTEEGDLFQKWYNYFSNVGTHRLGSEQEHVRIAKNTTIEWGLLLVGRVQTLP